MRIGVARTRTSLVALQHQYKTQWSVYNRQPKTTRLFLH